MISNTCKFDRLVHYKPNMCSPSQTIDNLHCKLRPIPPEFDSCWRWVHPKIKLKKKGFSTDKLSYVRQLPPEEKALLNPMTPKNKFLQSRLPTFYKRTSGESLGCSPYVHVEFVASEGGDRQTGTSLERGARTHRRPAPGADLLCHWHFQFWAHRASSKAAILFFTR